MKIKETFTYKGYKLRKTAILLWIIFLLAFAFSSNLYAQQKGFSLGIMIGDVDKDYASFIGLQSPDGVYVKQVLKDSPSDRAGLKTGDVITEVNGKKVKNALEFLNFIKNHNPDEELNLQVVRAKGESLNIKLKLVEVTKLPDAQITKPASFDFDKRIIDVDKSNFDMEVLQSQRPVLVYFYAKWCPPCKKFVPSINEIAKNYGDIFKVVALDVQKSESIAKEYGIGGLLPSMILFNGGNEFDKIIVLSSYDQVEKLLSKFRSYTEEKVEIFPEVGKEDAVEFVSFVDNSNLVVSKRSYKISVWDFKNGSLIKTFYSPVLAVSTNGRFIALVDSKRSSLEVIDLSGNLSSKIKTNQFIHSLALSGDGRFISTSGKETDGTYSIKIWAIENKSFIKEFSVKTNGFSIEPGVLMDFSPDGNLFVISEYENTRFFDTSSWKEISAFKHPEERFRNIRFTPDGKFLLAYGKKTHLFDLKKSIDNIIDISIIGLSRDGSKYFSAKKGNFFEMVDTRTQKILVTFPNYLAPVRFVTTSYDDAFALSAGGDGSVKLWDNKSGKEIAQFIDFSDGEWVVVTKEGYYSSSQNGHKHLKIRKGQNVYTIEQFYDVFYRPDIVTAKLKGDDISSLITLTIEDAIKNPPPSVEITSIPENVNQPKVKVCYQVKSTGGGIGEVRLFHNGKLIHSDGFYREIAKKGVPKQLVALNGRAIYDEMRGIKINAKGEISPIQSKSKGEIFEECREIYAVAGENEVSIAAFNAQNTVQSFMKTRSFIANIKADEPHLYILAIGIDKYKDKKINLKYAVKDAMDIAGKIKAQASTIYNPQNIHAELIIDEKATKSNILNKLKEISQKIKPSDSFILFAAGHGVLMENQYYMLTHDFDGVLEKSVLISSNEIVDMSKQIKSLSQLFIFDTCHAGGVDYIVSGLYDARMSVLAKKMGLHIYASASSKEEAMDGYKGNGLFTYTILDGLNNNRAADRNNDKKISVVELGGYSKQMTAEISKKIGHTQTPLIINFGKDIPVYNLR